MNSSSIASILGIRTMLFLPGVLLPSCRSLQPYSVRPARTAASVLHTALFEPGPGQIYPVPGAAVFVQVIGNDDTRQFLSVLKSGSVIPLDPAPSDWNYTLHLRDFSTLDEAVLSDKTITISIFDFWRGKPLGLIWIEADGTMGSSIAESGR